MTDQEVADKVGTTKCNLNSSGSAFVPEEIEWDQVKSMLDSRLVVQRGIADDRPRRRWANPEESYITKKS